MVRRFFELFGHVGVLAPGLAVIAILIATHAASGEPWRIRGKIVAVMYVEASVLAMPLLALSWVVPLTGGETCASDLPPCARHVALHPKRRNRPRGTLVGPRSSYPCWVAPRTQRFCELRRREQINLPGVARPMFYFANRPTRYQRRFERELLWGSEADGGANSGALG